MFAAGGGSVGWRGASNGGHYIFRSVVSVVSPAHEAEVCEFVERRVEVRPPVISHPLAAAGRGVAVVPKVVDVGLVLRPTRALRGFVPSTYRPARRKSADFRIGVVRNCVP